MSPRTPGWLAAQIDQARRKARLRPCPSCYCLVLYGFGEDETNRAVWVSTIGVDPETEFVAFLAGTDSFAFIGGELHRRDNFAVGSDSSFPIYLEHTCARRTA